MNRTLIVLSLVYLSARGAEAAPSQIAFERSGTIWLANAEGKNARQITKGSGPDLSPDGQRIAFHTDTSSSKDVIRHIAVADVASHKVAVFKKEIPSDNCQRAVWSPDGTHILFSLWSGSDWHLGLVNADGSGFRYLKKSENRNSLWSFCWTPDGRSIYAQDLNNLYLIDTDGKVQRQWKLEALFSGGSFNSGSTFSVSPDGKSLLMEVDMDNEEANMPDWDGPPPSIWILDIATEKATRFTPKGMLAWHPAWLDSNSFVYASQSGKEKNPSVFRGTLNSPERNVLIKNANNPSASRAGAN